MKAVSCGRQALPTIAITRNAEPLLVFWPRSRMASENYVGYIIDIKNDIPSMA